MRLPFGLKFEIRNSKFEQVVGVLTKVGAGSGFTMIELLVVIAVIGVLAVAVLSSINPIEQINKGRDTRARSDAAQLISAVDRYFAIHEEYPWNTPPDGAGTFDDPYEQVPGSNQWGWAQLLVDTAEVKATFVSRLEEEDKLTIFKPDGDNETMFVCFLPVSEAFKQEAAKNCTSSGTTNEINGGEYCATTDGLVDDANYVCLP